MNDDAVIEQAKAYICGLFRSDAGGHDADHTMRVYRNALLIAGNEPDCDLHIVSLAALLHDADDHKLFATENNANARAFLNGCGVSEEEADMLCEIINEVSFSQNKGRKAQTIEAQIVQDADRLDAMGAIGIARTFAYGGEHGRPLQESVQHFHDKLLRLKELMNTDTGSKIAENRHAFLEEFLKEYYEENDMDMMKKTDEKIKGALASAAEKALEKAADKEDAVIRDGMDTEEVDRILKANFGEVITYLHEGGVFELTEAVLYENADAPQGMDSVPFGSTHTICARFGRGVLAEEGGAAR